MQGITFIMELVNSAPMQLGRMCFVEASMFMFTVANTVALATHLMQQRTAVAARVLLCTLYLCIADFPRNMKYIRTYQRSLSALQSSTGFPIIDGRLQD